jgi:hypothetical protein
MIMDFFFMKNIYNLDIINKWTDFLIFHWKKKNKTRKWKRMVLCYYIGFNKQAMEPCSGAKIQVPTRYIRLFPKPAIQCPCMHELSDWRNGSPKKLMSGR